MAQQFFSGREKCASFTWKARIDEDLTRGIRHYRNKAGDLLTTLDEVIHAILANDLMMPETKERELIWTTPRELAA